MPGRPLWRWKCAAGWLGTIPKPSTASVPSIATTGPQRRSVPQRLPTSPQKQSAGLPESAGDPIASRLERNGSLAVRKPETSPRPSPPAVQASPSAKQRSQQPPSHGSLALPPAKTMDRLPKTVQPFSQSIDRLFQTVHQMAKTVQAFLKTLYRLLETVQAFCQTVHRLLKLVHRLV